MPNSCADELAYCSSCGMFNSFDTVERMESSDLDGVKYRYLCKVAICSACGGEASYAAYTEENGRAFNEAVRKANSLASPSLIRELVYGYGMSFEGIASYLGYDDGDVARHLMAGTCPSQKDSDKLEELFELAKRG